MHNRNHITIAKITSVQTINDQLLSLIEGDYLYQLLSLTKYRLINVSFQLYRLKSLS